MPTHEAYASFWRDWKRLAPQQQRRFLTAVRKFVHDLSSRGPFRPGLRVKGIEGAEGIFEMTWAPDGRATFEYGPEVRSGEAHIIWRRIGTHEILDSP
jgi:hypothetical protein